VEPEGSLQRSKEPAIGPYPESEESTPHRSTHSHTQSHMM